MNIAATIYDFPTNYEEKIIKADQLIEKGYIDQAICFLEDLLQKNYTEQVYNIWKKKLITCYMLKKEFDLCKCLVDELLVSASCDLAVRAHDILIATFSLDDEEVELTKRKHEEALGRLSVYYRSLIELSVELKAYYQAYWSEAVFAKITKLIESKSLEEKYFILSDLQNENLNEVIQVEAVLKEYFLQEQHPITKTMLYELLVQQNFDFAFTYNHLGNRREMCLQESELSRLYQALQSVLVELDATPCICETDKEMLQQHLVFFFQFAFPFDEELALKEIIPELIHYLSIESKEKNDIIDSGPQKSLIINYTKWMMKSYIQSLSSIM